MVDYLFILFRYGRYFSFLCLKFSDKFDEIFNSAKYKKCLLHIKEVRKQEMDKVKMDKNSAEHYRCLIVFSSGVDAGTFKIVLDPDLTPRLA